jgi:predicted transcriptional regulator
MATEPPPGPTIDSSNRGGYVIGVRRSKPVQPLGELESALMNVVWRSSSATAREVADQLKGSGVRAYTTVMTTLDRLHRKGVLERRKEGPTWRYAPVWTKPEFEKRLADTLASKILADHGEAGLAAFVDAAANVDDVLLDKLRRLIDVRQKGKP